MMHLPSNHFLANRRTSVGFGVQLARLDVCQQLLQGESTCPPFHFANAEFAFADFFYQDRLISELSPKVHSTPFVRPPFDRGHCAPPLDLSALVAKGIIVERWVSWEVG